MNLAGFDSINELNLQYNMIFQVCVKKHFLAEKFFLFVLNIKSRVILGYQDFFELR